MTREERTARWRGLVEEHAQSGMSGAAFCKEYQINPQRFYSWRNRFKSDAPTGFIELVPCSEGHDSGIRIRFDKEPCIELERGFDPASLRKAVEILWGGRKEPCLP